MYLHAFLCNVVCSSTVANMTAMRNFKITSEKFKEFVLNNNLFTQFELNDCNKNISVQRGCTRVGILILATPR